MSLFFFNKKLNLSNDILSDLYSNDVFGSDQISIIDRKYPVSSLNSYVYNYDTPSPYLLVSDNSKYGYFLFFNHGLEWKRGAIYKSI